MSLGIERLQSAGLANGEPVFTNAEIRALVEQKAGLDIPNVSGDVSTGDVQDKRIVVDAPEGSGDTTQEAAAVPTLAELPLPDWVKYAAGNRVETLHGTPGILVGIEDGQARVRHEWQFADQFATYPPENLRLVALREE